MPPQGGAKIGYSEPTYLCEMSTAWRNNALMYYMQEAGVFARVRVISNPHLSPRR